MQAASKQHPIMLIFVVGTVIPSARTPGRAVQGSLIVEVCACFYHVCRSEKDTSVHIFYHFMIDGTPQLSRYDRKVDSTMSPPIPWGGGCNMTLGPRPPFYHVVIERWMMYAQVSSFVYRYEFFFFSRPP